MVFHPNALAPVSYTDRKSNSLLSGKVGQCVIKPALPNGPTFLEILHLALRDKESPRVSGLSLKM
jgi:hypothetical protein